MGVLADGVAGDSGAEEAIAGGLDLLLRFDLVGVWVFHGGSFTKGGLGLLG